MAAENKRTVAFHDTANHSKNSEINIFLNLLEPFLFLEFFYHGDLEKRKGRGGVSLERHRYLFSTESVKQSSEILGILLFE